MSGSLDGIEAFFLRCVSFVRAEAVPLTAAAALTLLCLLFAVLWFRMLRPKRGTTEWFRKIEVRKFSPPVCGQLMPLDTLWLPLGLLGGAALGAVPLFLTVPDCFSAFPEQLLWLLLSYAMLSAAAFMLLRLMDCAPPAALSAACLLPVFVRENAAVTALLVLALLFFWLWCSAPVGKRRLLRGLWLVLSVLCYGIALRDWRVAWLLPLFITAYIAVLSFRCRRGELPFLSLLLTLPLGALWSVLFCTGLTGTELWQALRSFAFYETLGDRLLARLAMLRPTQVLFSVSWERLCPLLAGAVWLIPLLHGLFRQRDIRTVSLLLCLLSFFALYLGSGANYLALPLLLLSGWFWNGFCARRHGWLAVLSAASLFCTEIFMIYISGGLCI